MSKIKNWEKVSDRPEEIVWVNQQRNLRVVAAKGARAWQSWYERNIGKVASDESYIRNAYITEGVYFPNKETAVNMAVNYMRRHS